MTSIPGVAFPDFSFTPLYSQMPGAKISQIKPDADQVPTVASVRFGYYG